jgi:hypothetical protein
MAKSLPPLWFTQLFDNLGELLAGGKIQTYAGGTTTPLATYTDAGGLSTNTNPVILDSAGRADIWLTPNVSYKFVLMTSADVVLETVDAIISVTETAGASTEYDVCLTYCGTPGAQGFMGAIELGRAVTFPINFDGAQGSVQTAPAAPFVISVEKNGVEVGTISIATTGVFTFATTGGTTVVCIAGDTLAFFGPDSVGTAADFALTLVGDLP